MQGFVTKMKWEPWKFLLEHLVAFSQKFAPAKISCYIMVHNIQPCRLQQHHAPFTHPLSEWVCQETRTYTSCLAWHGTNSLPLKSRFPIQSYQTGWPSRSSPKNPPGVNLERTSGGFQSSRIVSRPKRSRNTMCCWCIYSEKKIQTLIHYRALEGRCGWWMVCMYIIY